MAATEESIYNRLASAPQYHPSNASLFADWNMQAGDVVQIKSDDSVYDVPIYNLKLKWNGASKIDVESTGNPEREPLPALKRREYSSNSSNYAAQKSYGGGLGSALEKIANINGIMYAAGLQVDPVSGVLLYASEHGSDYALGSSFKVQSDAITQEVTRATAAEGEAYTRIQTTADGLSAEVARASDAEGALSTRITVNAEGISTKVEKNGVISAINQSAEAVTINANRINLEGYVTATSFEAEQARLTNLMTGQTQATTISTQTLRAGSTYTASLYVNTEEFAKRNIYMGGTTVSGFYLGDANLNLAHYHAITATENNGVITITQGAAQDTPGSDSFNIADTQFYKDAVASAKNAMGVQIDQANQSVVVAESATKSALIASTVNLIYNTNNNKYTATTAATANGTTMHTNSAVSGTEAYDAGEGVGYLTGWNAAVAAISRNGNSIIGPATSDGSSYTTETKYTANYTPSAYTQETHRYTPSTYVAESHSYTPSDYTRETTVYNTATVLVSGSSHSHSNAWIRQDSGSRIYYDTTLNLSGDHSVTFDSGSDSYTKETTSTIGYYRIATGSSYTASTHSYTASVYDAETHSYTPSSYTGSSFSWS